MKTINNDSMFGKSGAIFSKGEKYRYKLWRIWDETKPLACFVGLNPSTADASVNDRTVTRCAGFAAAWGMGGFYMLNVFALRSTDPKELHKSKLDPIGADNMRIVRDTIGDKSIRTIIAAWGIEADKVGNLGRGEAMAGTLAMRKRRNQELKCLGLTAEGKPKHPLYLAASTKLVDFLPLKSK
jgi:hypothetical protein